MDFFALRPAQCVPITGDHPTLSLLFCGKTAGRGQLVLTIKKAGELVAQFPPVYLELLDIKDMYERWTVGDGNGAVPDNVARLTDRAMSSGYESPRHSRPFTYNPDDVEEGKFIFCMSTVRYDARAERSVRRNIV